MSINIDTKEVEKFSAYATKWWDKDGEFKTLHHINPVRLAYIESRCSVDGKYILDIGCGGGLLSEAIATKKGIVTGIDASIENIACAREHANESGYDINYQCITAEEFAKNNIAKFDVITCMELLEHVPDPASLVDACSKLVKPGGHVFFSTLNRNIKSYALAVVASEYILKLLPNGTHDYERFIRPSELANWCKSGGLEVRNISGMKYNPLLNTCQLTTNPDVNYLMQTIKSTTSYD